MVQDLRHSKSSDINGTGTPLGPYAGGAGTLGEIWTPLILSTLIHGALLVGLLALTPYLGSSPPSLPPAQMVQLVDLPSGGGGGGGKLTRDTPPPRKLDPVPEVPKAEKPPAPKPPEPKVENADKAPPPKPKPPAPQPEMALPTPKAKEPPKKEPLKREGKKPEPAPRSVAEKPVEKTPEVPPAPRTSEPPSGQSMARVPPERSSGSGRPGPGLGFGSGLSLGGGSGMLSLDSANFPFSYYLRQVTGRIEENWVRPQQDLGRVVIYFRIKRDGTIVAPQIHESSRNSAIDLLASGAIKRSEPFPPLPVEFGGDYLGIYLCFGLGSACPGQKEG